jgi:hypothetical protein
MARRFPALSRERLARVLGLSQQASPQQIESTIPRLLDRLRRRLEGAEESDASALLTEIEDLESSVAGLHAADPSDAAQPTSKRTPERLGALLGLGFALAILIAYAAGLRITRVESDESVTIPPNEAMLVLDGPLVGATLRVLDPDREELLLKVPAENARLRLAAGRYALEVSREDCPDRWTRSVFFEPGQTRRFEPALCLGEGALIVRSNVSGDRLKIDGFDRGPTGAKAHPVGVGDHDVRVEKDGFEPFEGKVRIRPGESLELRAELVAAGPGAPIGRPMPVEKVAPARAPAPPDRPAGPDLAALREGMEADAQPLGLPRPEIPLDEILSHTSTGGGSTAWHDRVSADLLARYDADGSGHIDRLAESESISCEVWLEIERDFDGGGLGLTMVRYYGFDGSEWHPSALGFTKAHRSAVFERMKECGLRD